MIASLFDYAHNWNITHEALARIKIKNAISLVTRIFIFVKKMNGLSMTCNQYSALISLGAFGPRETYMLMLVNLFFSLVRMNHMQVSWTGKKWRRTSPYYKFSGKLTFHMFVQKSVFEWSFIPKLFLMLKSWWAAWNLNIVRKSLTKRNDEVNR